MQRAPTSYSPPLGGGGELRDSASRKSSTSFTAQSVGFGLRAPRVGRRPSAQARRFYEPQKHSPFVFGRSQQRTNIKAEAASKRHCASPPHSGAAGRPLTRRLSYSLSTQIQLQVQPKIKPNPQSPTRPSAAGKPETVFPPEEQTRAQPTARLSSPPRVSLTAAPLSLRRITVARWDFISILLTAK